MSSPVCSLVRAPNCLAKGSRGGTPFLPPVTDEVRLDLVETRTFGSRVIYERYGRPQLSRTDTAA